MNERVGAPAWRAVVIEDHADFASAVRELVEADGSVAVEAVCHTLALGTDLVRRLRPELVLTDFRLPDGDAVEQFSLWREASPGSQIIVTSAWTDDRSVRRARDGGAVAYVDKTTDLFELPALIGQIMSGAERSSRPWPSTAPRRGARSTPHLDEHGAVTARVLDGVLDEESTHEIARRLGVSELQVRHEVSELLRLSGVRTRAELRAAQRAGGTDRVDC